MTPKTRPAAPFLTRLTPSLLPLSSLTVLLPVPRRPDAHVA